MPVHADAHPLSGQVVTISNGVEDPAQSAVKPGAKYKIEDWWDRVSGRRWGEADGNPACLHYAMRAAANMIPPDDEVLYGKIDGSGHLVHVSEIDW
jgi:hypothetical protein